MSGQVNENHSESPSTRFAGFDHLELYVGNARQAAYFYQTGFGFTPVAYAGPETGVRDRTSFVVAQGEIRLVLTSALGPEGDIAAHFLRHDDGVRDIALSVTDARSAFAETVANGARPILPPTVLEDECGRLVKATVAVFGDTVHSFIERNGYAGVFAPGYQPIPTTAPPRDAGLNRIDHLAISVEPGEADKWVDFYTRTFGLEHTQSEDISSEYSGMKTDVVRAVSEHRDGQAGQAGQ
ncbi:MAG: VOC family protein, partial [Acidobacteriota bacterium]